MTYRELLGMLSELGEDHLDTNVAIYKDDGLIPINQCAILVNVPKLMQIEKKMVVSQEQPVFCLDEINVKIKIN
jgi:hypothetical protein